MKVTTVPLLELARSTTVMDVSPVLVVVGAHSAPEQCHSLPPVPPVCTLTRWGQAGPQSFCLVEVPYLEPVARGGALSTS